VFAFSRASGYPFDETQELVIRRIQCTMPSVARQHGVVSYVSLPPYQWRTRSVGIILLLGGAPVPEQTDQLLEWCQSAIGPCEFASDQTRAHPGERVGTHLLRTPDGPCFLKTHKELAGWELEVHGYERWARAFGDQAPKLLAVRDVEPLGIIISEVSGRILEEMSLPPDTEREVWRDAGRALAPLHRLEVGECFGPCHRDGSCVGQPITDAIEYVTSELTSWTERGQRDRVLTSAELATIQAAHRLAPAFAGEHATPCHRDYCDANWIIDADNRWAGVIDFEFAYWDVRAADFTRYAQWEWLERPDLVDAFFEGYGEPLEGKLLQQVLVGHVQYALSAVVWGSDYGYFGFAREGHQSFERLHELLPRLGEG